MGLEWCTGDQGNVEVVVLQTHIERDLELHTDSEGENHKKFIFFLVKIFRFS